MASEVATAESSAIDACGLVRTFGAKRAVDGVDLSVREGEIYGFLGPSGAGKTTLVKMLCTLLRPTSGTATVLGHDIATQTRQLRLRIGVAQQASALDDRQTGREILDLQARFYGLKAAERRAAISRAVELANLGPAVEDRVRTYSGGMKRRLDLAASLIHGPELTFLDEPTTGLDPVSRSHVWDEIRRLNRELGVTVFLTTQYLEEADALADRVGIIDQGRLVNEGRPSELKRAVETDFVVIELDSEQVDEAARLVESMPGVDEVTPGWTAIAINTADGASLVADLVVALSSDGIHVRSIAVRTPTLDDVFLLSTGYRMASANTAAQPGKARGARAPDSEAPAA